MPTSPRHPRPRTVLATGVFDLLHAEHLTLLTMAAALGDLLYVGINSDQSVRRLKGPGRPIIPEGYRYQMLMALRCVDLVEIFHEDTPLELIKRLRPAVLVKGHDYLNKPVPEAEILKEWGGQLVIAPTSGHVSTSQIINHIRSLPA